MGGQEGGGGGWEARGGLYPLIVLFEVATRLSSYESMAKNYWSETHVDKPA